MSQHDVRLSSPCWWIITKSHLISSEQAAQCFISCTSSKWWCIFWDGQWAKILLLIRTLSAWSVVTPLLILMPCFAQELCICTMNAYLRIATNDYFHCLFIWWFSRLIVQCLNCQNWKMVVKISQNPKTLHLLANVWHFCLKNDWN